MYSVPEMSRYHLIQLFHQINVPAAAGDIVVALHTAGQVQHLGMLAECHHPASGRQGGNDLRYACLRLALPDLRPVIVPSGMVQGNRRKSPGTGLVQQVIKSPATARGARSPDRLRSRSVFLPWRHRIPDTPVISSV